MVNEKIEQKINQAHDLIDGGQYDAAVEIMKNLKTRIHDRIALDLVMDKEKKVEEQYNDAYKTEIAESGNPLERFTKSSTFINEVNKQRAQEYLKFYDQLNKTQDL